MLLACGIRPDRPGAYNITFSVTSSSGLTATVSRGLTIRAACPEGEKLCADMVNVRGFLQHVRRPCRGTAQCNAALMGLLCAAHGNQVHALVCAVLRQHWMICI